MSDELKEVVEAKEVKEDVKSVKAKYTYWQDFFKKHYELPNALHNKLSKHFDETYGAVEVDAEFDFKFQRDVIRLVIEYSEKEGLKNNRSWHEVYSEIIVVFSNKSIGDIVARGEI